MRGKLYLLEDGSDVHIVNEAKAKAIVDELMDILACLAKIIDDMTKPDGSPLPPQSKVRLFSELAVAIFNFPIVIGYATVVERKSTKERVLINNFDYLVAYAVERYINEGIRSDLYEKLKEGKLEDVLETLEKAQAMRLVRHLSSMRPKLAEIYEVLRAIPSDTRPGLNLTSLPSHMLLTSVIAWSLQSQGYDLPTIRLASIFHDVGKIASYRNHVKGGEEFFDQLLGKLEVSREFKSELIKVAGKVKTHHQGEGFLDVADDLSSAMDRISSVVQKAVKENPGLKDVEECFRRSGKESFDCFDSLPQDRYKEATRAIFEKLREELEGLKSPEGEPVLNLVYIDFQGIQRFISSFPKLKQLSTASFLVDFLVSTVPFIVIDNLISGYKDNYLPLEAMLSGYGGHSMLAVIAKVGDKTLSREELSKRIMELKLLKSLDVNLGVYASPMVVKGEGREKVRLYTQIWRDLEAQMLDRSLVTLGENVLGVYNHKPCPNCGVRPANSSGLCSRCDTIDKISDKRGFSAKVGVDYSLNGIQVRISFRPKDPNTPDPMDYLAGDTGRKRGKRPHYISVVKFDANNASAIYMRAITLGLFLDISYTMDFAIKQGFYETLTQLLGAGSTMSSEKQEGEPAEATGSRNNNNDLEEASHFLAERILVGVIYLGGDEGLLIIPAIISIPFSLVFLERVSERSKFKFKCGVVTVKPNHPIQFAIQGAEEVMEKAKLSLGTITENTIGIVHASSGLVTDETVETTMGKYADVLQVTNDLKFLREVLSAIMGIQDSDLLREVVKLYQDTMNEEPRFEVTERVKDAIRTFEDVVSAYAGKRNRLHLIAYLLKRRADYQELKKQNVVDAIEIILRRVANSDDVLKASLPVLDVMFLLKTLRSGMQ